MSEDVTAPGIAEVTDSGTATEVTAYVAGLEEPARSRVADLYARARRLVPEAVEGRSYGMPALLYENKGLLSVMSMRKHIGVYPFGSIERLADGVPVAPLETTKGSIHLRSGEELPETLLVRLLACRVAEIEERASERTQARVTPVRAAAAPAGRARRTAAP